MNDDLQRTDADAIAEIARDGMKGVEVLTIEHPKTGFRVPVAAVPEGVSLESVEGLFEPYRVRPTRRKGTAVLGDLESFIAHTKRFASEHSVLFADPKRSAPRLVSVLDYHEIGSGGAPAFGEHRGDYRFPLSDEWLAWTTHNGSERKRSQSDFAAFVEEHIVDVADPASAADSQALRELLALLGTTFATPSRLLELSRGLAVHESSKVAQAVNLSTGESSLTYSSEVQGEGGAPLKVPGAFLIAIPVFRGGAAYRIAARLRFRVREGAISWWYDLHGADRVFDHAFREACETAQRETGLPLFVGSPE